MENPLQKTVVIVWSLMRFRYRGWMDNAVVNDKAAQEAEDTPEVIAARKRIRRETRKLLRRMWRLGFLEFRFDQDILFRFCPLQAKIYRFAMELMKKNP